VGWKPRESLIREGQRFQGDGVEKEVRLGKKQDAAIVAGLVSVHNSSLNIANAISLLPTYIGAR